MTFKNRIALNNGSYERAWRKCGFGYQWLWPQRSRGAGRLGRGSALPCDSATGTLPATGTEDTAPATWVHGARVARPTDSSLSAAVMQGTSHRQVGV